MRRFWKRSTRAVLALAMLLLVLLLFFLSLATLLDYEKTGAPANIELEVKLAPLSPQVLQPWSTTPPPSPPQRGARISGVTARLPQRETSPSQAKTRVSGGIGNPPSRRGETESPPSSGESVGLVMSRRAQRLRQACVEAGPPPRGARPPKAWVKRWTITRPFSLCVAPKGGSTSWKHLMKEASLQAPGRRGGPRVVVARHPLARLASAYRDKFLNGSPLEDYNATFRRLTGSRQTWLERWKRYWLPALIHRGLVQPSPTFLEILNETSRAFQFVAGHGDAPGALRGPGSSRAASGMTPRALRLAKKMVATEMEVGMVAAVEGGFPGKATQAKLQQKLRASSFTFVQFLDHVLWTWKIGLVDSHWTPISHLCDPCGVNYAHVLSLERPQEVGYLLELLEIQEVRFLQRHMSIGTPGDPLHLEYYEDVPREVMERIYHLYQMDFKLFGYEEIPLSRFKPGEEIPLHSKDKMM